MIKWICYRFTMVISSLVGIDIRLDFLVIVSDRHISEKSILLVLVQRRRWPNCFMAQSTKDRAILSYLNLSFILQYCPSWLRSPEGAHQYWNLLPTIQIKMSKHLMLVVWKCANLVANLGTQHCIIYIPLHVRKKGCPISIWALI